MGNYVEGWGWINTPQDQAAYDSWVQGGKPRPTEIIPQPPATIQETPGTIFSNTKSGAGTYYLLPAPLFNKLHRLRDRFISKKHHKRVHPLI